MSSLLDTGGIIAEVAKLHTLLTEVEVQEHVLKNIPVKAGKYWRIFFSQVQVKKYRLWNISIFKRRSKEQNICMIFRDK